jgi:hypothetical protein
VQAVSSVRPHISKGLGDWANHFLHPDRSAQDDASPMELLVKEIKQIAYELLAILLHNSVSLSPMKR